MSTPGTRQKEDTFTFLSLLGLIATAALDAIPNAIGQQLVRRFRKRIYSKLS